MRILVCPTSFKESLGAGAVTDAMIAGVRRARPGASIRRMPVSDGGPGLLEAIRAVEGGVLRDHAVSGPLGAPVRGMSLWTPGGDVVLEAADACGLHLMAGEARDPLHATTRGVGELVDSCLGAGASSIFLGLGGSGSVDGGCGLARALGYVFRDTEGKDPGPGGGALVDLARIEWAGGKERPGSVPITAIADVRSPLLGPDGAARRFGPQKGATPQEVEILEAGLVRLAQRLREDLGRDVADLTGAGAAGGLGAGCAAFLDAELVPGSRWVLDRLGFDDALQEADLVVSGEGAYDPTTDLGKIVGEIVRRASDARVPVALVCGTFEGPVPPDVVALDGKGSWLGPSDLALLVAEALA